MRHGPRMLQLTQRGVIQRSVFFLPEPRLNLVKCIAKKKKFAYSSLNSVDRRRNPLLLPDQSLKATQIMEIVRSNLKVGLFIFEPILYCYQTDSTIINGKITVFNVRN